MPLSHALHAALPSALYPCAPRLGLETRVDCRFCFLPTSEILQGCLIHT